MVLLIFRGVIRVLKVVINVFLYIVFFIYLNFINLEVGVGGGWGFIG